MENGERYIERKKDHRRSFKENAEQKKQAKKDRLAEIEAQEQFNDSCSDSERERNVTDSPKAERGKRGRSKERKQAVRDKSRSRERVLDVDDTTKETRNRRGRSKERKKDKDKRSKSKERCLDSDSEKDVKVHQKRGKSKERKEKRKSKAESDCQKDGEEKEAKSNFLNPKTALGGFLARFRTPSPRPDKEKIKKKSQDPDRKSLSSSENVSSGPSTPSEEKSSVIEAKKDDVTPQSDPNSSIPTLKETVPLSPTSVLPLSPTNSLSPKSPFDANKSFLHKEAASLVTEKSIVRERCFQFSSQQSQDSVDSKTVRNHSFLHDSEVIATNSVSRMKNLYEGLGHQQDDFKEHNHKQDSFVRNSKEKFEKNSAFTPSTTPSVSVTVQKYDDDEPIYDNVDNYLERAASCHSIASIDNLDDEPIYREPTLAKPERIPVFMDPDYRTYSIRRASRKKSMFENIQKTTPTSKFVSTITKEYIKEESIYENIEIRPPVLREKRPPSDEASSEETNTTDSGRPRSDESLGKYFIYKTRCIKDGV